MKIFLSYASQDRAIAAEINQALLAQGHNVFFDRDDLPAGEEFHNRIRRAIEDTELFVFLISEQSLDAGSYTLNELNIAEKHWQQVSGHVLPVMIRPTSIAQLPPVLKSVTVLESSGNIVAATADAVSRIASIQQYKRRSRFAIAAALIATLAAGGFWWQHRALPNSIVGQDGAPANLIPAGRFVMGDDEESPKREVFVAAFYLDQFEVTTGRYAKFLHATGDTNSPDGWDALDLTRGDELPVVGVSWHDAQAYCEWVDRRLPTEAEWERAARGDDGRLYPWGNDYPGLDRANYQNASPNAYDGGLTKVGMYRPGRSPYEIFDMAGNAAEWVADWYSESFSTSDRRNPRGPSTGERRVIRGGGRFDRPEHLTATKRYSAAPDTRAEDIGFRCAITAK